MSAVRRADPSGIERVALDHLPALGLLIPEVCAERGGDGKRLLMAEGDSAPDVVDEEILVFLY